MEINGRLKEAAIEAVRNRTAEGRLEVPGYPGTFVSDQSDMRIAAISSFVEDGIVYVIGPLWST